MAGGNRRLKVFVDLFGAEKGNKELTKMQAVGQGVAQNLQEEFLALAGTIGAAFAVQAVVQFSLHLVQLGIDVQETKSLISASFGEMSQDIIDWSKTSSAAITQTSLAAQEAAANIFNLAKSMGLALEISKDVATIVPELAADLGSFFNRDILEAQRAIVGGLVGETEALKSFGIVITESDVKRKAAELGLNSFGKELANNEKIMARLVLIADRMGPALGDVNRTADEGAGVQRQLAAAWDDTQIVLGTILARPITDFLSEMNEGVQALLTVFGPFEDSLDGVADAWSVWLQSLAKGGAAGPIIGFYVVQLEKWFDQFTPEKEREIRDIAAALDAVVDATIAVNEAGGGAGPADPRRAVDIVGFDSDGNPIFGPSRTPSPTHISGPRGETTTTTRGSFRAPPPTVDPLLEAQRQRVLGRQLFQGTLLESQFQTKEEQFNKAANALEDMVLSVAAALRPFVLLFSGNIPRGILGRGGGTGRGLFINGTQFGGGGGSRTPGFDPSGADSGGIIFPGFAGGPAQAALISLGITAEDIDFMFAAGLIDEDTGDITVRAQVKARRLKKAAALADFGVTLATSKDNAQIIGAAVTTAGAFLGPQGQAIASIIGGLISTFGGGPERRVIEGPEPVFIVNWEDGADVLNGGQSRIGGLIGQGGVDRVTFDLFSLQTSGG